MKIHIAIIILSALLIVESGCAAAASAADKPSLDVNRIQGIVIADRTSYASRAAVSAVRKEMKALYGIDLKVIKYGGTGPVIRIGKGAAFAAKAMSEADLKAVTPGGHVIRCDAHGVVIAGPDDWATLYGAYAFLEKLGYVIYGRSAWQRRVAPNPPKEIAAFTLSDRPVFPFRMGWSLALRGMTRQKADPRNALNPELFTAKAGSDLWIDHTAGYLVPIKLYYDKHPEYFAMQRNGKRVPNNGILLSDKRNALCLSNPEVTRIATERAIAWVKMQPDKRDFYLTYGDTGLWCHCAECRKLDSAPGKYAARLLHWVNPIARAVGRKYPGMRMRTFAYGGTDEATPGLEVADNLYIIGSTGLGNVLFLDHLMADKRKFERSPMVRKIDGWLKLVPNRYLVCEYVSGTYQPAMIDNLATRLRYYARRGLYGIDTTYGTAANFTPVWSYVIARLMWNPYQDAQKLAADVIVWEYGSAAPAIQKFFGLVHERYQKTLQDRAKLEGGYPAGYYAPEFVEASFKCFKQAQSAVKTSRPGSMRTRIKEALLKEERLFALDVLTHPAAKQLDAAAKGTLDNLLEHLFSLVATPAEQLALARQVHKAGVIANGKLPGVQAFVEQWLRAKKVFVPKGQVVAGGVNLPPEIFMYAGFGPGRYAWKCPPKVAVAIYVKGNSMGRSDWMEARFDLDKVSGNGVAELTVEAQDGDQPLPPAEIRIELNGITIYKGKTNAVKQNWSLLTYPIRANILRKGENVLRFYNVTNPHEVKKWNERWFMFANALIKFK